MRGWVEYSASKYIPALLPILEKITVISARGNYEHWYPGNYGEWKIQAFLEVQRKMNNEIITNLISLGDSNMEMDAVHVMGKEFSQALIKTIKFRENPTPEELVKQLELVAQKFEKIILNARNLKIGLERKYSGGDQQAAQPSPQAAHPPQQSVQQASAASSQPPLSHQTSAWSNTSAHTAQENASDATNSAATTPAIGQPVYKLNPPKYVLNPPKRDNVDSWGATATATAPTASSANTSWENTPASNANKTGYAEVHTATGNMSVVPEGWTPPSNWSNPASTTAKEPTTASKNDKESVGSGGKGDVDKASESSVGV